MSIEVQWYDVAKTTLLVVYSRKFALEEFYTSVRDSYAIIESVDYTVDIIQDVTKLASLPPNILSVTQYVEGRSHPRRGVTIIVGLNRFVKIMLNIGGALAPKAMANYHYVATMEEAQSLLHSLRQARDKDSEK